MNFIHQINCPRHRRKYRLDSRQQRYERSAFVDDRNSSNAEMDEMRAAQHELDVIYEYIEKAGKANAMLTSEDIKHNIDWLLAEARCERDGEFTAMNAYNRLYSRIPPRQPVIDQVNDNEVVNN
jgi:hypothetical protein